MAVDYTIKDIDPQIMVMQITRDLRGWLDRMIEVFGQEDQNFAEALDLIESLEDAVMGL